MAGRLGAVFRSEGVTSNLFLAQCVAAGVAFVVNLLAASVMTPSDRGNLALLLQIAYLLTVVALLGVERPFVAGEHGAFGEMIAKLDALVRPGWISAAIPLAGSVWFFASGSFAVGAALLALTAFFVFNVHTRMIRSAYIASGAAKFFSLSAYLPQLALLAIACLLAAFRVADVSVWMLTYAVTSGIAGAIVLVAMSRRRRLTVSADPVLSAIRKRGLKLFPASLGNTAMLRSDRLLLPLLANSAQLGIYVVVATVMELATWPIQQWVDASLRKWSTARPSSRKRSILTIAAAGGVVLVLSSAGGLISYLAVVLLLPHAYQASLVLILPLGLSSVFYGMSRVQQGLLIAHGSSGRVSAVEITGMVASVAGYVILIPLLGAMGAALGSVFGYGICFIVGSIVLAFTRDSTKRDSH